MKKIFQIEYWQSILQTRAEILGAEGFDVTSVLGTDAKVAMTNFGAEDHGVIVVGHGAEWRDRKQLIAYLRQLYPDIPVVALLRRTDEPFENASHNCPADNPVAWLRIVRLALEPCNAA